MGLVFVIFGWLVIFSFLIGIYLFIEFLAKNRVISNVLKNTLSVSVKVLVLIGISVFMFSCVNIALDYFNPNRVFTRYLGISPTEAVKNLEGYDLQGYSSKLEFQTDMKTIDKINEKGFLETDKIDNSNVPQQFSQILQKPRSHSYAKRTDNASYYLAYDEESGQAYFFLVCLD